jgi:hypothetical protein
MNFRLNSFFWMFAGVLAGEHIVAFFTGVTDELYMLVSSLSIAFVLYILRPFNRKRPKAVKPPHEHYWRHWYDADGYYAAYPNIKVPSRVYYCVTCREVRRSTDPIPTEEMHSYRGDA